MSDPTAEAFKAPNYQFHEIANMFPMINEKEMEELAQDIKEHGLLVPIMLYEDKILDGRNRYDAAKHCGYQFKERDFRTLYKLNGEPSPKAFVISANIRRRHLSTKKKQEPLAELIKDDPTQSDRKIASVANVDNKTVAAVRNELELREEIPHVETRTDSSGRKQPAAKDNGKGKRKGRAKNQTVINEDVQPTHSNYLARLELMVEALREWPKGNVDLAKEWADEARGRIDEVIEQLEEADDEGDEQQEAA